jgi:hypothetical protein
MSDRRGRAARAPRRAEDERGAKWWFLPHHLVVSILPTDVVDALDAAFVPLAA